MTSSRTHRKRSIGCVQGVPERRALRPHFRCQEGAGGGAVLQDHQVVQRKPRPGTDSTGELKREREGRTAGHVLWSFGGVVPVVAWGQSRRIESDTTTLAQASYRLIRASASLRDDTRGSIQA